MSEISKQTVSVERVPSGIAGFDQLLQGGFFKGETYLLMGPPGAGKTTLEIRSASIMLQTAVVPFI